MNATFGLTLTCGLDPTLVPTFGPTAEHVCSWTDLSCGDSIVSSLELFSTAISDSTTTDSTNTSTSTVTSSSYAVNMTTATFNATTLYWSKEEEDMIPYDIYGTFAMTKTSSITVTTTTTVEVSVHKTSTVTYGTTGIDIFSINVTAATLDHTFTFSTCSNFTNYDTFLSLYDACPTEAVDDDSNITLLAVNNDDAYCSLTNSGASELSYKFRTTGRYYVAVERYAQGADLLEDLTGYTTAEISVGCSLDSVTSSRSTWSHTKGPTSSPTSLLYSTDDEDRRNLGRSLGLDTDDFSLVEPGFEVNVTGANDTLRRLFPTQPWLDPAWARYAVEHPDEALVNGRYLGAPEGDMVNASTNVSIARLLGSLEGKESWPLAGLHMEGLSEQDQRMLAYANTSANTSFSRFLGAIERGEAAYWNQGNQDVDTMASSGNRWAQAP